MTVTTNGIEFKRFYLDEAFWPDDLWSENEKIFVDGHPHESDELFTLIPDTATVKIVGGYLQSTTRRPVELMTYEGYFRHWQATQVAHTLVVTVPPECVEAVRAAVLEAGGVIA